MAGAFAVGRVVEGEEAASGHPRRVQYPFRGEHQAGIATPAQDRLHFAAFDVTTDDRDELVELLQEWTEAAERMTRAPTPARTARSTARCNLPPDDTGEAIGLPPSG